MDSRPEPRPRLTPDANVTAHRLIRVFATPGTRVGGNPAPVWLNADALSTSEMQERARASGHESVFVLKPADDANHFRMRYFVPAHEMEMCGHATIAALWLLQDRRSWDGTPATVETASGPVQGRIVQGMVEISQPSATVQIVDGELTREIAECLRIDVEQIVTPVLNASTSRVKTLIRLARTDSLHALTPDLAAVQALCGRLGSTGLYPFAMWPGTDNAPVASARQFPKSSGYAEDPATGIAAAALAWGLRDLGLVGHRGALVTVRQGEAMGSPSSIFVQLPSRAEMQQVCWLRGDAQDMTESGDAH